MTDHRPANSTSPLTFPFSLCLKNKTITLLKCVHLLSKTKKLTTKITIVLTRNYVFIEVKNYCLKLDKSPFGNAKHTMFSIFVLFLAVYEPDFVRKSKLMCCI